MLQVVNTVLYVFGQALWLVPIGALGLFRWAM